MGDADHKTRDVTSWSMADFNF